MDEPRDLEDSVVDLSNIHAALDVLSYWTLAQSTTDRPIDSGDRDALIGAIEAMGWAVKRVESAYEDYHRSLMAAKKS